MNAGRPLEILIVEDSYVTARLAEASLARAARGAHFACEFTLSTSAARARSHMARHFDAILLDLNLADAEPGEVLIPRAGPARVVVLSGLDPTLDAARLARVRALTPAALLAKPTAWDRVARAVLEPWIAPEPAPEPR